MMRVTRASRCLTDKSLTDLVDYIKVKDDHHWTVIYLLVGIILLLLVILLCGLFYIICYLRLKTHQCALKPKQDHIYVNNKPGLSAQSKVVSRTRKTEAVKTDKSQEVYQYHSQPYLAILPDLPDQLVQQSHNALYEPMPTCSHKHPFVSFSSPTAGTRSPASQPPVPTSRPPLPRPRVNLRLNPIPTGPQCSCLDKNTPDIDLEERIYEPVNSPFLTLAGKLILL